MLKKAKVRKAYGRMFGYVDAAFDATRLTDEYKANIGGIKIKDNDLFVAPEKSWLISYDKNQFKWAKIDLIEGKPDENMMNEQNGVIAVAITLRNNITSRTANLRLGDEVHIETPDGTKVLTIMGILRSLPFSDSKSNLTTFITTEKQFTELTGEAGFKAIDIQLESRNQEQAVQQIKDIGGNTAAFFDSRQKNAEMDQTFLTMAVFIYGFVAVIALINTLATAIN